MLYGFQICAPLFYVLNLCREKEKARRGGRRASEFKPGPKALAVSP